MTDRPLLLAPEGITDRMKERLATHWEIVFFEDIQDFGEFVNKSGGDVVGLLPRGHHAVDSAYMDQFPNLKIISNFGVGYDSIDAQAAADKGIFVGHTPDVLNDEVANTAIMMILAVYRDLINQEAYLRAGRWKSEGDAPLTRSIAGRTFGIVGLGRIGKAIANKLQAFGVELVYHTRTEKEVPYKHFADLRLMAEAADALIVITPGGPETDGLISKDIIEALGPDGVLINISRGSVVDQPALISALQDGRLGAAGLDVFSDEPNVPKELIEMSNVVLLPHVGSATKETRQAMADLVCDNLNSWLDTGRPICPVPECQAI